MSATAWETTPRRDGKTARQYIDWTTAQQLLAKTTAPPRFHKCRTRFTLLSVNSRSKYVTRYCACGAVSADHGPWTGKNRRLPAEGPRWLQGLTWTLVTIGALAVLSYVAGTLTLLLTGEPY